MSMRPERLPAYIAQASENKTYALEKTLFNIRQVISRVRERLARHTIAWSVGAVLGPSTGVITPQTTGESEWLRDDGSLFDKLLVHLAIRARSKVDEAPRGTKVAHTFVQKWKWFKNGRETCRSEIELAQADVE